MVKLLQVAPFCEFRVSINFHRPFHLGNGDGGKVAFVCIV